MDKVTRAFTDFYSDRIADGVADIPDGAGCDQRTLAASVTTCVAQRLQLLIPRLFVVDFHQVREAWGQPVDPQSTTAIDRYLEGLGTHTVERWFETYPVMADLVGIVVDGSITHVGEIAMRWQADRAELAAREFVPDDAELTGIEHLASDAHQNGRMVAALRFADGSRVIYKPRSLTPEEFTRSCLAQISGTAGLDLEMCAPESLDRGDYGWQREVLRRGARSRAEIRGYYTRLGAVCGLLTSLGATDMHHENIIAVGDHPVVLDLETVLHAAQNLASHDLATAIVNRVKTSLASTLLLPQRLPKGPYSVLLGGIGVAYEQQSSRTDYVMVNRDTDAVDIAKRTWPFVHQDNLLKDPAGHTTDVLDYRAEFLDGLRRGTEAVAEHAEALVALLDTRPIRVRQIFRSTAVYGRVLDAATHPDNLRSREEFERIITMLRPPPGCDRQFVQSYLAEVEKAALARADVPYFVASSDDIRTRSEGHLSPPVADLSPRDRAAYGLRAIDSRSLSFDELLVEEGFAELRAARLEHERDYRPGCGGTWGAQLLASDGIDGAGVLQRLVDVSIDVDGVDGVERGWVCGAFGPSIGTFDPGTSISLHDAGGILLPFERAAEHGDDHAKELAREVRRGVGGLARVYRERLDAVAPSVASGSLSIDYLLGHASTRLPMTGWDAVRVDDVEACPPGDPMAGLPGAGLLFAGFPDSPPDLLRRIYDRLPNTVERQWELAHGNLGLLWARHRLAVALGEEADVRDVEDRFDAQVASVPESLTPAWCAGHAGVCMVAAEISRDDALVRKHAELAATLPADDAPIDLSVCHGAAGVVQALVRTAQLRDESWPLTLATDYWQRVAKYARDSGYVTGDPARQGLLGYFLGWSGIADTALLLATAREGERVWVPLSFTSSHRLPEETPK